MDFKQLINRLETDPEILDKDNISIYISSFKDNKDNKDFLLSLLIDKKNNIPYLRNIYTIIIWIFNENKEIDLSDIQKYLYEELNKDNLKEWTKIIFTNLLIQISNISYLEKIIDVFNKQIEDKSVLIWSIERFTDYFCEFEKWKNFVDSFLYFRNDWIRWWFGDWLKWLNNRQKWILSLSKDKYIYFLKEIWTKKGLKQFVWHLNDSDYEKTFVQEIINKWFELNLKDELYNFLVSLIKYWNDWWNNHYKEKVYYKQIQDFLNRYRKKYNEGNFFINFFDDISYDKKWFYYFRFFEEFIANILQNKNDVKFLLDVEAVKDNNYILAYRIYDYLNNNWKNELVAEFESIIWDKIDEIKKIQKDNMSKNNEYLKKHEKEKYDEIKSYLESFYKKNGKYFTPIIFKYYLENEELLFSFDSEIYDINKLINNQINYFLKWENLNPWNSEVLKWLQKTETWYNWFTWYFDDSLELVLKVSEKIGFDLSPYKGRLLYYIPFQILNENLDKLLNICWLDEFEKLFRVYKNYPNISSFHPQNIITYYEKVKNKLDNDLNKEVLEFLREGLFIYKSFYDKEKVLDFLSEFWESKDYFQYIFDQNKWKINYFNPWNTVDEKYQNFRLALKSNEILIKGWDLESLKWRIEQIKLWKTENREYKNWFLPEDDINLWDDDFIRVFKEIKNNDNEIINLFIDLLSFVFKEYWENYINYSFYIFKSFNYYLSWLSNLSINTYLILKISEVLSKIDKLDAIIYFKRYIIEFENGLFLSNIEKEILKIENSSYKSKDEEISKKDKKIKEQWKLIWELLKEKEKCEKEKNNLKKELEKYKERELFFKDIVLIVEWKTDKNIIEYVYKNVLLKWETPYYIFNAWSSTYIENSIKIFNNDNYKKIIALYDFDNSWYLRWNWTDRIFFDSSINTCLKKKWCNDKIYDLLLPLPLWNEKLKKQVIKDYNIYEEWKEYNSSNIDSLHYWEYSLIDLELLFYWINEKIDDKFFIENENFPNKPITYKWYRKNNTWKDDFLKNLKKFYRDEKIDLIINEAELFKNIIIIINEIEKIVDNKI